MFLNCKYFLIFIFYTLLAFESFSQKCTMRGTVVDNKTNAAMPYVNIVLTSDNDTLLLGALTNENGIFLLKNIEKGTYDVKISFIGYQSIIINDLKLEEDVKNIGKLKMHILSKNLEEINIKATASPLSFKVDRKVINAKSFPNANTAIDLLENIPSVRVDFEGNLTYRGGGSFKVFINGHPVANGDEKLRQISADKIDKIEIITNPSAKYDAEGTAGIIQVILKKNRLQGYAISTSIKASTLLSYNWSFSIEKNVEKGGWYVEGNIGDNVNERNITEWQDLYITKNRYQVQSVSDFKKETTRSYLEFGLNYDITKNNYVDFSIYVNPIKTTDKSISNGIFYEKKHALSELISDETYIMQSNSELLYQYIGGTFTYEHAFNKDRSHLLSSYFDFSTYISPSIDELIDRKQYSSYIERAGYLGKEQNEFLFETNISYKNSLTENTSLEAGININIDHIPEITSVSGLINKEESIIPFATEPLNQKDAFVQDVYSMYLLYKSKIKRMEYQLGFRTEFTDRASIYSFNNSERLRKEMQIGLQRWDFFPTFHALYNLSEHHQLGLSFSRRIERPDYWSLIPFSQYSTPYSYYKGNGKLMAAYSNSIELVYKKLWNSDFIGVEIFVHNTNNIIQNYTKTDTARIVAIIPGNLGSSQSIGTEVMAGVDIFSWWNFNVSTSLYLYSLNTNITNVHRNEKQFNSNTRINNSFLLPKAFTLKFDINYNSPTVLAQGKIDNYFYSNFAINKSFSDGAWLLALSISDVYNTNEYSKHIKDKDLSIKTKYDIKSYLSLKLTYTFNNQK